MVRRRGCGGGRGGVFDSPLPAATAACCCCCSATARRRHRRRWSWFLWARSKQQGGRVGRPVDPVCVRCGGMDGGGLGPISAMGQSNVQRGAHIIARIYAIQARSLDRVRITQQPSDPRPARARTAPESNRSIQSIDRPIGLELDRPLINRSIHRPCKNAYAEERGGPVDAHLSSPAGGDRSRYHHDGRPFFGPSRPQIFERGGRSIDAFNRSMSGGMTRPA